MRATVVKREITTAERQRWAVADHLGYEGFKAFHATLPADPAMRKRACDKFAKLLGAFVADGHGEAALHCTLAGAVVAGAPAFQGERRKAADDLFKRRGGE